MFLHILVLKKWKRCFRFLIFFHSFFLERLKFFESELSGKLVHTRALALDLFHGHRLDAKVPDTLQACRRLCLFADTSFHCGGKSGRSAPSLNVVPTRLQSWLASQDQQLKTLKGSSKFMGANAFFLILILLSSTIIAPIKACGLENWNQRPNRLHPAGACGFSCSPCVLTTLVCSTVTNKQKIRLAQPMNRRRTPCI